MKIENIKLFLFISKKIRQINIIRSSEKNLIIIEPKTIFKKAASVFFKPNFTDKNSAKKLIEVIPKARRIEMNWEKEKIFEKNKTDIKIRIKDKTKTNRKSFLVLIICLIS
jgi:hypothetical protein